MCGSGGEDIQPNEHCAEPKLCHKHLGIYILYIYNVVRVGHAHSYEFLLLYISMMHTIINNYYPYKFIPFLANEGELRDLFLEINAFSVLLRLSQ